MRRLLPVVAILLIVVLRHGVEAQAPADAVRFATDVEKARAHLLVSEELYAAGQARTAALHAAHPVQELGNRLVGPVRRVDAPRAERVRAALRDPGRAIEAKTPSARYAATVTAVVAALDDAVTRVVGVDTRASVAFRLRVLAALLEGMSDEYEEAFKDGRITQVIEYQDAYGFFRRAQALHAALPPDARRGAADFAALAKALPSREPPANPMSAERMKDVVRRLGAELTK